MRTSLLSLIFVLLFTFLSNAQEGIIRGTVIEDETGEPMFSVTVVIAGTTNGAITDFDGKFEIKAEPGTYDVQASFVSYQAITINGVVVNSNEVTVIDNIRMAEDTKVLEEIVVSAEALKDTESALLTVKKKSVNLIDGISAANFRKIGDANAAAAITRVPGVSIEGGKYVYVRGLGDRYTKSILNGVDIPGLDPDRNTLQMDIFPTNVIDNLIVLKSFTADLPADFTGGVVNIETKEFPEEKNLRVSGSLGYNPSMHFNSNYLTYPGGSTDWLGFDDGTREIPTGRSEDIPVFADVIGNADSPEGMQYRQILENFNPNLAAMRQNSFMDYSIGLTYGNQIAKDKVTIGYNFALTYKNETDYYEGAEYSRWGKGDTPDVIEMERREHQVGDFGINNVLLGGLAGLALKTEKSKYKLNLLHLQNGENKAGIFEYVNSDQGANFSGFQHNLEYGQRSLSNILLTGKHFNDDASFYVEWKLSPTRSVIDDPDIRFTRFRTDGNRPTIGTESGIPARIWRYLEEYNAVGKVDATKEYQFAGEIAKFRFGASYTYKQRDYEIQSFQIIPRGLMLTGDPNQLFLPESLWPTNDAATQGTYYSPGFIPNNTNKFDSNVNNVGAYVSNEMNVAPKFKTIVGLRVEKYNQFYTGQNQQGDQFDQEQVLDDLDFFPTASVIYSFRDNQNFRVSYSKTIARPSFKEASFAEILDPITGRTFIGGFFPDIDVETGEQIWDGNLVSTKIDNFDLRWEIFHKPGQTISISGFYKSFKNPIEIVQYVQASNNFQPRNVGDGRVLGGEFEIRQSLDVIAEPLKRFMVSANITVVDSEIEMTPTEYQSRINNSREGESISNTREMAGQAPYIVNLGFSYEGINNGFEAGFFYNVQGETLEFVGIADRPDIYSVPFHSVNFNANKTFGEDEKFRVGLKIENLLGDIKESKFHSYEAQNQQFTKLDPGTKFRVNFSYNLWR